MAEDLELEETKPFLVRMSPEMHAQLKARAKAEERSMHWLVLKDIEAGNHPVPLRGEPTEMESVLSNLPRPATRPSSACKHPLANRSKGKCLACGSEVAKK